MSHQFVRKISLDLKASENYTRPTLRRYIDKHGNLSWMETAKINEPVMLGWKIMKGNSGQIDISRNGVIVDHKTVTKAAESLGKIPSENYTRPTFLQMARG